MSLSSAPRSARTARAAPSARGAWEAGARAARTTCAAHKTLTVCLFFALALIPQLALARTTPKRLWIDSTTPCPDAELVQRTLSPLLPDVDVRRGRVPHGSVPPSSAAGTAVEEDQSTVNVTEQDGALHVNVEEQDRKFTTLPAQCEERARLVAVFVKLHFDPPEIAPLANADPTPAHRTSPPPTAPQQEVSSSETSTESTLETSSAAPATASPHSAQPITHPAWRLHGALSALAVNGVFGDTLKPSLAFGGMGRLWYGRPWAITAGFAVTGERRGRLELDSLRPGEQGVKLSRHSFDLGIRRSWASRRFEIIGELGPEFALLQLYADKLPGAQPTQRLDIGVRMGLTLSVPLGGEWAGLLSLVGSWLPRPYALKLAPDVDAGRLPAVWLGVGAGLSY